MISPALQLAQQNRGSRPLSQIGGNVMGLVQQQRQKKAMAAQNEAYQNALSTFRQDQTPDNLMNLYQVAPPGHLESLRESIKGMTEMERLNQVQGNMEIISALDSGYNDIAVSRITDRIEAAKEAGDTAKITELSSMLRRIENGLGSDVSAYFQMTTGFDEAGQKAIANHLAMQKNKREEIATEQDTMKLAADIAPNLQGKDKGVVLKSLIDAGYSKESTKQILEMADILGVIAEPMDSDALTQNGIKLYDRWQKVAAPYEVVTDNYDALLSLEGMDENGFATQGMITLWNKILDPESVVRQSEYANTEASVAVFERLGNVGNKVLSGEQISVEGQKLLREAAKVLNDEALKHMEYKKNKLIPLIESVQKSNPGFSEEIVFGRPVTENVPSVPKASMGNLPAPRAASPPPVPNTPVPGFDEAEEL